MSDSGGEDSPTRRARIAEAILAHRKAGSQSPVLLGAGPESDDYVEYHDREITVEVDGDARERLDDLLGEFPVFKIAQPATRKAPEGDVHISALADPKHAADFIDQLFLDVYEQPTEYSLTFAEP